MAARLCYMILLLGVSPLPAQPPEQGPPPRHVDHYGDPLPAGAVQRFGSLRLRHSGMTDFIVSPDGKSLVSVGLDKTIRRWGLESGKQLDSRPLADAAAFMLTLSADGRVIAGWRKGVIVVMDAATGRVTHTVPNKEMRFPTAVAVAADGARVAVAGDGGRVVLCDTRTGRAAWVSLAAPPESDDHDDMCVAFSPDGRRLAVGGVDGQRLAVLDAADGKQLLSVACRALGAAFLPGGDRVAVAETSGSDDAPTGDVRLIDAKTGAVVWTAARVIDPAYARVAVTPDGTRLAVGRGYRSTVVLDAATGAVVGRPGWAYAARFTPDGRRVVFARGPRLFVRDAATGRAVADEDPETDFGGAALSPDGRRLVAPNDVAQTADVWDVRTACRTLALPTPNRGFGQITFAEGGRTARAVCGQGSEVRSWDAATGRPAGRLNLPIDRRTYVRMDPAGRWLAAAYRPAGGPAARLDVSDAATGALLFRHFRGAAAFAELQSAGDSMVVSDRHEEHFVFDPRTGAVGTRFAGTFMGASADGRWLTSQPFMRTRPYDPLAIHEAASGQDVTPALPGAKAGYVDAVDVRGRTATVVRNRTLWVIDLATGRPRTAWPAPLAGGDEWGGEPIRTARILPDGRGVFTALQDGTALVWDLSSLPQEQLSPTHTNADLARWWADLAGDAKPAYAAIWKLAETPPADLMPFLRERLRPISAPQTADWLSIRADLEHRDFRVRATALKRVEAFGSGALDDVRREANANPAAETRERMGQLLAKLTGPVPPPETLRFLRALAVLEEVKTAEARRLVEALSRGVATAPETTAAAATLARMPDPESWGR